MTNSPVDGIEEEKVFTILSHPLRRKILRILHDHGNISFKEMSDWGIKTGTLYFHLRELGSLIDQNEDKHYVLTPTGLSLAKWFIGEQEGKTRVSKINSFTLIAQPIHQRLEQSTLIRILVLLITLTAIIIAPMSKTLLFGPLPLPALSLSYLSIVVISTSMLLLQYVILASIVYLLGRRRYLLLLVNLLVAHLLNFIVGIALASIVLLPLEFTIHLTLFVWLIISILSQIYFILILTGSLIIGFGIKPLRAILITVIILYTNVAIALAFNLF